MKTKDIIKAHYFDNPSAKMRVREIERELDLSLPSVIRYVKELTEEKILATETISNVTLFVASHSAQFTQQKMLYNLNTIFQSGIIDYIRREYANPTIILFGSYLRGEDIETSDIDLFIQTSNKVNLAKFEKKIKRKIQVFSYSNIQSVKNIDLANNIVNGLTLNGYMEILK